MLTNLQSDMIMLEIITKQSWNLNPVDGLEEGETVLVMPMLNS
jgi:hypothetical protein